jgi:glutathione S-transferase
VITSSTAIAKYIAATAKPDLLGTTDFEKAQVDQWLLYLRGEVQPIARTLAYQVFGHEPTDNVEHTYIVNLMKDQLKLINGYLKGKTYFVGKSLTIVDIYFTLIMLEQQQALLETNFRNSMSGINSHFKTVTQIPEFKKRMGNIKQGKKQIAPIFGLVDKAAKDLNKASKKEKSKQAQKHQEPNVPVED